MYKLQVGQVSTNQLAEWFGDGCTRTFTRNKEERLATLNKEYCDIEPLDKRGKYYIFEVYKDTFEKEEVTAKKDLKKYPATKVIKELIIDSWKHEEGYILSEMVRRHLKEFQKVEPDLDYEKAYSRASALKRKHFGFTKQRTKEEVAGIDGISRRGWCKVTTEGIFALNEMEEDARMSVLQEQKRKANKEDREEVDKIHKDYKQEKIKNLTDFLKKLYEVKSFDLVAYKTQLEATIGYPVETATIVYRHVDRQEGIAAAQEWLDNN